ncbi:hypothetical protein [Jeotgalibacillus sp. R-1-5s-1]|uniref:hypothetical protein n=1 Tax=Jeotgalibacillus sp. R-1-5s-1 TaxID=2555897 RepID=UPI00106B8E6E|nr:hypothetical protein [Jeotgalibacillus sp. R-1-5s-1]TFE03420.1 hypothetical protein E2491_01120 [Jeotgalibacillus sp. R-1-5s-1]
MEHHIQAYFRNESDAETALAKLQKCPIRDARIDSIPDGNTNPFVLPALNFTSSSSPNAGVITDGDAINTKGSSERFDYILEFYVEEQNRREAVNILGQTEAHLDKEAYEKINK